MSNKIEIIRATPDNIPAIKEMAEVVFRKTYGEILSPKQMEYMIDWMYSAESLYHQISDEGRWFFIVKKEETLCGYCSIEREGETEEGMPKYHLQKLYALPQFQGQGIGKQMFNFLLEFAKGISPSGCRVQLNVNRYNKNAVNFYEHIGMRRIFEGDFHIGHGFYMTDYIYALELPGTI